MTTGWKKRTAAIASTQASRLVTSCTRPRMNPRIALPPTRVSTMMSRAVRLAMRRSLVAPEHQVNEFAQSAEAGDADPVHGFHPLWGPAP